MPQPKLSRAEILRLCRFWIKRGWTHRQVRQAFPISPTTLCKLRKKMGKKYEPRLHNQAWGDDMLRAVQGEIDEAANARHSHREPFLGDIAAKYGVTELSLRGRMYRWRKRCRLLGIAPGPPDAPQCPTLSWIDDHWKTLQAAADAMPQGRNRVYAALAERVGIPRKKLVRGLRAYRERCRKKGIPCRNTAPLQGAFRDAPPSKRATSKPIRSDEWHEAIWKEVCARWNPTIAPTQQRNIYEPLAAREGISKCALINTLRRWRCRQRVPLLAQNGGHKYV